MEQPKLAIVIPVYNSAKNINNTFLQVCNLIKSTGLDDVQIILVNDASTDGSLKALMKLANENKSVLLINMAENSGQNAALYTGISNAGAALILTIDDDFPYAPEEVAMLIDHHIKSGKKITFGVPVAHKIAPSVLLKFFFPSHRNVQYHSSLRVFGPEVKALILKKKALYPALFLSVNANNMAYQIMYTHKKKELSRYNIITYWVYYRSEIVMIIIRLLVFTILVCAVMALISSKFLIGAGISIILLIVFWLINSIKKIDYSKLKYEIVR